MIRQKAKVCGLRKLSNDCLLAVANEYVWHVASKQYRRSTSLMRKLISLRPRCAAALKVKKERNWVRARYFEGMGDILCLRRDLPAARKFYLARLHDDPRMSKVYVKLLLLLLGRPGDSVRSLLRSVRTMQVTDDYGSFTFAGNGEP